MSLYHIPCEKNRSFLVIFDHFRPLNPILTRGGGQIRPTLRFFSIILYWLGIDSNGSLTFQMIDWHCSGIDMTRENNLHFYPLPPGQGGV